MKRGQFMRRVAKAESPGRTPLGVVVREGFELVSLDEARRRIADRNSAPFAALASAYGRVVAHASDWRAGAAQAAAARADAIVIVSPPARLEGAVRSAQTTAGESYPEILAFRARTPQAVYEDAA